MTNYRWAVVLDPVGLRSRFKIGTLVRCTTRSDELMMGSWIYTMPILISIVQILINYFLMIILLIILRKLENYLEFPNLLLGLQLFL